MTVKEKIVPMSKKQRDLIDSMNEFCGEKFEYSDKTTLKIKQFPDEDEDILNFLFASDCEGKISYKTCKKIYDLIKDVDFGGRTFTYMAYSDGKDYERFKEFLRECYRKRTCMRWS